MTHLTDAEFVDLLDGDLAAPRAAHVERCEACRSQVDAMRGVLSLTATNAVPEPSPLFWSHLSAHVRETIATQPIEPDAGSAGCVLDVRGRQRPRCATLVLVAGIWRAMPTPTNRPIVAEPTAAVTPPAALSTAAELDADADDDIDSRRGLGAGPRGGGRVAVGRR